MYMINYKNTTHRKLSLVQRITYLFSGKTEQ